MPDEIRDNQPQQANKDFVLPEKVRSMLTDPNLNEEQRQSINLNAQLMGSFLDQALGGGYTYNLDGVPNWNKKRKTSSETMKFSAILRRDPSAIRNDITVSETAFIIRI